MLINYLKLLSSDGKVLFLMLTGDFSLVVVVMGGWGCFSFHLLWAFYSFSSAEQRKHLKEEKPNVCSILYCNIIQFNFIY